MAKPTAQQCHSLITYFSSKCEAQGVKLRFNRNTARWNFESILWDNSMDEARAMIDFYVDNWDSKDLDMNWFLYNYEKVQQQMEEKVERDERQRQIREETKERMERWNERW